MSEQNALTIAGHKDQPQPASGSELGPVLIVGNPNVGKSAIFNALTGRYVTVSNYPGTTVEICRGRAKRIDGLEVIDTPGMYSLTPITEEERVAQEILLEAASRTVIHVIDAKNIARMLGLTLQLIEAGQNVVLVLNMWDEALQAGVTIDTQKLRELLGIPIVATIATRGQGIDALAEILRRPPKAPPRRQIDYGPTIERAISQIVPLLDRGEDVPSSRPAGVSPADNRRTRAVLLLHGDHSQRALLEKNSEANRDAVARIVWETTMALKHTPHYETSLAVRKEVESILSQCAHLPPRKASGFRDRLSELCMSPLTGLPLLAAVLFFGLYEFVGSFGAGYLVDKLGELFSTYITPWVDAAVSWIPSQTWRDLFAGEFGIVTLGLRYAIAIIFPIVGTFFLAFSILEDSGYLPRLAMLMDRVFKRLGLSGRAVIPMVLGFGCDTMATIVTRTLETRRERAIATFLLALAIPCSAQMGVILGLLAGHPLAVCAWAAIIAIVFVGAGLLAAKFLPGERPSFYMELPPMRLPRVGNVLVKTYTRMIWYFKEVLPLFVLASVIIWVGRITGIFQWTVSMMEPVVQSMGLPKDAAMAFVFGFFRRDYGAAGLYDLHAKGVLAGNSLLVAAVTLTLFLPCIAQFLIMKKERGWRLTLLTSAFIIVFAYAMGLGVHWVLRLSGLQL